MPHDSIELNLSTKRIPYFDLKNKKYEKTKLKKKLMQFNQYLKTFGLSFQTIKIAKYNQNDDFKLHIEETYPVNDDINAICQIARDKAGMSDRSYKAFRRIISPVAKIVSLAKCVSFKKKVDEFWQIENNEKGSFISDPLIKINFVCKRYLDLLDEPKVVENNTFNILLSGDSFTLTKTQTKLFNFTFSLLNDGDMSHNGFYILGIYQVEKEDYTNIKSCLHEIISKLKQINELIINTVTYNVVFHIGGDLKWLSTILGIGAGNSDYPCPWCTWKSGKKENEKWSDSAINTKWSINDRNHDDSMRLFKEKTAEKRKGYIREPLFSFIKFGKCVVDPLHLMLRISDKLFDLLLLRLEKLDKKHSNVKIGDISTYALTSIFLNYLKDAEFGCNLTNPFYTKDNEFKLRSLNENERIRIFEKLFINDNSLCKIFPANIRQDSCLKLLNDIFKEFYEILNLIKIDYRQSFDKIELELKIKNWLKKLVQVDNNITPYTHILCFHVTEFIEIYRNLNLFSMQGLEKLNHITKMNYFRQTNHQKNFTIMLLKKMNRMEFIHLKGNISEL